jgi:cytochrome c-type biogenesis protein CcmH
MRRLAALCACAVLGLAGTAAANPAATLPDIEDEVMCVTCGVPLNTAQSPQAERQRELIRGLLAEGRSKEEIKDRLVDEYGVAVLAMPEQSGFGRAAYVVPVAVVAILLALLALLLPRWRRRAPAPAAASGAATDITAAERDRLDDELSRL